MVDKETPICPAHPIRSKLNLAGAEMVYQEYLAGVRFVIKNPNAASTCGCGNSFTV